MAGRHTSASCASQPSGAEIGEAAEGQERGVRDQRGMEAGTGTWCNRKAPAKRDRRAGSTRDARKPAVVGADSGDETWRFAGTFTGATGLEPATSGVTGRSW